MAKRVQEQGQKVATCMVRNITPMSALMRMLGKVERSPTIQEIHDDVPAHGIYCSAIKTRNALSNVKQLQG